MKLFKKKWDIYFLIVLIMLTAIFITTELGVYLKFKVEFHYSNKETSYQETYSSLSPKKYKIGIIIPSDFLGDAEVAQHMYIAAQNLGWDSYIFQYEPLSGTSSVFSKYLYTILSIINYFFKPDFIIHLLPSYFTISPNNIPNYVRVPFDLDEIFKDPENFSPQKDISWANIGAYDGYMHIDHQRNWNGKIDIKSITTNSTISNFKIFATPFYPSVFSTHFTPLEYNKIFYCGANWDSRRNSNHYKEILTKLAQHNMIEVFGPKSAWEFIKDAYKGYILHDGSSLIKKIQELGIVLILHSKYHLETGIPTNRIFEAAAASSLIISDVHPFVKKEFGNCILYIDPTKPVDEVVDKIAGYVKWAKKNPKEAQAKAKCIHEIFANKFPMEKELLKIVHMHKKVLQEKEKNSL